MTDLKLLIPRFNQAYHHPRGELLGRALGRYVVPSELNIVDATAGFGIDACIFAAMGCRVLALEREKVLFDALVESVGQLLAMPNHLFGMDRLMLINQDALLYFDALLLGEGSLPDVIYLDPMFEPTSKKAKTKKGMQALRDTLVKTSDSLVSEQSLLLDQALKIAKDRVLVKRKRTAPWIGGLEPSYHIETKQIRIDVYKAKI